MKNVYLERPSARFEDMQWWNLDEDVASVGGNGKAKGCLISCYVRVFYYSINRLCFFEVMKFEIIMFYLI